MVSYNCFLFPIRDGTFSIADFPYSRRPLDIILPLCRNTLRELQIDLMVSYWSLMDALSRVPERKSFLLPKARLSLKR